MHQRNTLEQLLASQSSREGEQQELNYHNDFLCERDSVWVCACVRVWVCAFVNVHMCIFLRKDDSD